MLKLDRYYKDFDWILVASAMSIFLLGLLFLFSATYTSSMDYVIRQVTWFLAGCLIFIIMVRVNYRKIVGLGYILYFMILILLIAVHIFGSRRFGAQRWLELGFLNLQPSEFAKLFVPLALIQYLTGHKNQIGLKNIFISLVLMLVPFILILEQPDLGTAIMLVPIFFVLLFIWGMALRYLLMVIFSGLLASPFMWFFLKDYQKERLMVFLNPDMDPLGAGYTVIQSKIAIGSGNIFGKGWLSGTQNQLNFLAERHTDFIFSVAGEEWGFLGCVVLVALYYILVKRCLDIAKATDDPCGVLTAAGLGTMIGVQVIVNVSMTMGFMPVVGLPLPLVSYGGSSLLVTMMALGMIESIAIHR